LTVVGGTNGRVAVGVDALALPRPTLGIIGAHFAVIKQADTAKTRHCALTILKVIGAVEQGCGGVASPVGAIFAGT
jgi:hypothetical protein